MNQDQQQHNHIQQDKKRKFDMTEMVEEDLSIDKSLLSTTITMKKFYPLHILSNVELCQFSSDYITMSNIKFKQILSTYALTHFHIDLLDEYLDTEEKITFIRQLIQLIDKLNYFKLQDEQWSYYYQLGLNEGIWTGRVSKKMAHDNSMSHTYGRRKRLIEQRRTYFQEQLKTITRQIQQHLQQPHLNMDTGKLMIILNDFIDKDNYHLRIELERRRQILKFDAKDHQLVQIFYQLKPRKTEIHSAKIIWKAIYNEQLLRYEIAIFKNWLSIKQLSSICTFKDLQLTKINDIITHVMFDQQLSVSTINSTNSTVTSITDKFIQLVAQQTISSAEIIAQEYLQKVIDEKQKILNNQGKFKKSPTVHTVITSIENRQLNMIHRAQYNTEQQLKILLPNRNSTS